MADNYLERKMDEYRQGAQRTTRYTSPTVGTSTACLGQTAFVYCATTDGYSKLAAVVQALRDAGCRVDFVCTDVALGRKIAQGSGARHFPMSDVELARQKSLDTRGALDIVLCLE